MMRNPWQPSLLDMCVYNSHNTTQSIRLLTRLPTALTHAAIHTPSCGNARTDATNQSSLQVHTAFGGSCYAMPTNGAADVPPPDAQGSNFWQRCFGCY